MSAKILLITPSGGFGELIRQALVDDGGYDVALADSGIVALDLAQDSAFNLAILDCDTTDVPPGELINTLFDWYASIRLIVVPPGNDPAHPILQHITPHAYLTKPFYLPDMLKIVGKVLEGGQVDLAKLSVAPSQPSQNLPTEADLPAAEDLPFPWLQDVNRAAQYLARLSLETAARAALIVRGEDLWAYAGDLPQPDSHNLASLVGRQWGRHSGTDLAQFVKLENGQEFMLYATALVRELVLALVFDARTPFSKIRSQASHLAHALASAPQEDDLPRVEPAPRHENGSGPTGDAEPLRDRLPRWEPDLTPVDLDLAPVEPPSSLQADAIPLDWFAPQADASSPAIPSDWMPAETMADGPRGFLEELLSDPSITGPLALDLPAVPFPYQEAPVADETRPSTRLPQQPIYPAPEGMSETRPTTIPIEDSQSILRLEPDSANFSNITFACLLVPRLPHHHLVRDLAKKMEEWLPMICVAFNWRLEQLSVRPEYLQWMVSAHSATAPGYLMQITARTTSARIFHEFPRLLDENPSGEFWAPGWVITSRNRPLSPDNVRDFIEKTRRRQGLG